MSLFVRRDNNVVIDVVEYDKQHASDSYKKAVYYDECGDRCFIPRECIFPLSKVKYGNYKEGDVVSPSHMPSFKGHTESKGKSEKWLEEHYPTLTSIVRLVTAIQKF